MIAAYRLLIQGSHYTYAQIGERLCIVAIAAYNRIRRLQAADKPLTWAALGDGEALARTPNPASRVQRMLAAIAGAPAPMSLDEVVTAIDDGTLPRSRLLMLVSTQLSQQTHRRKLKRTGAYRDYRYGPTDTTLVDGRKCARAGRTPRPPKPKARAKPRNPKPLPRAKPAPPPKPAARERLLKPRLVPPAIVVQPETVAQFLKRGGRIQKLKPGECSTPLFESVRALNEKTMRKRLSAEADNDPIDDDADVAA